MKKILATVIMTLFTLPTFADHSDNGKCIDEIKHWNSLSDAEKNEADAKAKRDEGTSHWVAGEKPECEADYKQAIILATD
jgi:hypothetical protein